MEQIFVPLWYRFPHKLKKYMKQLTEEWMTGLRLGRRSLVCEIYQRSVTTERKHTDQIHLGAAGVFVLLGFFRCVSTPLTPRVCAIVT
ncbi:hypothetical protein [Clostridium sp. AN503]|uniref:hypothetical protein n=1 Tax=Clostridium sp. AN503 TaxID=3160598 RepID=UPI003457B22B